MTLAKISQKYKKIINVNEFHENFESVISELKWCQNSVAEKPPKTRDKWYKSYSLPEETYLPWHVVNTELDKSNIIDPQYKDLQVGDVVSSIEAVTDSVPLDTRPKVFDNLSKQWVLLDTGSCVSCI